MRHLLALVLAIALPATLLAQEKGTDAKIVPIKVVELNRKDTVLYEKEVEPIFYKKCVTCHSGAVKEARFDISSYEGVVKGGKRGTTISPGKKAESNIYKFCTHTVKPFMPPRGETPLSPEELAVIGLWIDQGAKAPLNARPKPKVVVSLPPTSVQPVRAIAISPDKTIVAASRANQIHLYEGTKGDYVRTLSDPALKVGEGKDAKEVKAAHLSLVESLAFSPDGKYLVSGSFQEIAIWDPKTGELKNKITGFAHEIVSLAFSADGKLLATGGGAPTEEGEVKFFDTTSWKLTGEIKNGHSDTVYGLSFNPDGKMITTCSADKFVKVWEVATGKFVKSFEGHTHHVLDVGWSPDGKFLASAGGDNTVKVWDFDKGEQARTINAHGKQVTRLMFIGKKLEVLTCGGDSQVKVFNVTNGGAVKTYAGGADFIYAIGVSPDGALVAAGGQEGIVRLYNGTTGALIRAMLPPDAVLPAKEEKKDEKKDEKKKK
jgi:WD40 repeat protein